MKIWPRELDLAHEILNTKPSLANNGAQGTAVQLLVVRDDYLRERFVAAQDHMTAMLSNYMETELVQNCHAFSAG